MEKKCPKCGYTSHKDPMEIDPSAPGLMDILAGKAGTAYRWFVTFALVILCTLFLLATRMVF